MSLWRVSVQTIMMYSHYSPFSSPDPAISVSVDAGVASPTVGAMYSLTCTVIGAERLTGSTITYQWFKNDVMVSSEIMKTLSFTSLSFSDAGGYTCEATVTSTLLMAPITNTSDSSVDITLTCKLLFFYMWFINILVTFQYLIQFLLVSQVILSALSLLELMSL